jgi:hypothetical protein
MNIRAVKWRVGTWEKWKCRKIKMGKMTHKSKNHKISKHISTTTILFGTKSKNKNVVNMYSMTSECNDRNIHWLTCNDCNKYYIGCISRWLRKTHEARERIKDESKYAPQICINFWSSWMCVRFDCPIVTDVVVKMIFLPFSCDY